MKDRERQRERDKGKMCEKDGKKNTVKERKVEKENDRGK